ncbi:MAG: FAD binding domain-containing protein [Candidatus Krumholzibacteria bacterium]
MMRLPYFRYRAPRTVSEAAKILAAEGPEAMLLAGGTDLLPNMKRRQQVPGTLVGLRSIDALRSIANGSGLRIGAGLTLSQLAADARVREQYTGLFQAAIQVATPHLRNMATLGGNICLDTRCNYYDQNYEWRKAIDFCMKKDGDICWVATGSKRCLAVSSTDTAPALMSLGARVRLVSDGGDRLVSLGDLYRNDGIDYITRRPDEIVTEVVLDPPGGWKSTYWKLRRRGSFDFPVLAAAVAVKFAKGGVVEDARIVLGAVASCPVDCPDAAQGLAGKKLTDAVIEEAATVASKKAKPVDNTDFTLSWRKRVARAFVTYALCEVRGDDMREQRIKVARHSLDAAV